jgi:hypothetical protein
MFFLLHCDCVQEAVFEYRTRRFWGARGSVVVKALCYKPEGRGFKSR